MSLFYTILLWEFFALVFKTEKTQQVSGYIYFLPYLVQTNVGTVTVKWEAGMMGEAAHLLTPVLGLSSISREP